MYRDTPVLQRGNSSETIKNTTAKKPPVANIILRGLAEWN